MSETTRYEPGLDGLGHPAMCEESAGGWVSLLDFVYLGARLKQTECELATLRARVAELEKADEERRNAVAEFVAWVDEEANRSIIRNGVSSLTDFACRVRDKVKARLAVRVEP